LLINVSASVLEHLQGSRTFLCTAYVVTYAVHKNLDLPEDGQELRPKHI